VHVAALVIQVYIFVIIVRIVLEWIPVDYDHPVGRLRRVLRAVTEPVLAPVRALVPPVRMGDVVLDLSPIIVVILLGLIAFVLD
jgi:YggT family protein